MLIDRWIQNCSGHERHWMAAYAAALCSPGVGRGCFRHGAVLVNGPVVVNAGFNLIKTHRRLAEITEWPYLHAETSTIFRRGIDNCEGLDLYVIRIKRTGDIGDSKPCSICEHFIKEAGIGQVFYSTNNGVGYG